MEINASIVAWYPHLDGYDDLEINTTASPESCVVFRLKDKNRDIIEFSFSKRELKDLALVLCAPLDKKD